MTVLLLQLLRCEIRIRSRCSWTPKNHESTKMSDSRCLNASKDAWNTRLCKKGQKTRDNTLLLLQNVGKARNIHQSPNLDGMLTIHHFFEVCFANFLKQLSGGTSGVLGAELRIVKVYIQPNDFRQNSGSR